MIDQEYFSELYKHISKEMMVTNMFNNQVRVSFPEPLASYYYKQEDDAKTYAIILEYYANYQ